MVSHKKPLSPESLKLQNVDEGSALDSCQCEIGDVREILTFSEWNGTEILKHFVQEFCKCDLNHEIGVINSRIKSGR